MDGQHNGTFEILDLRPTRDRPTEWTEAGSARLDDWAVPAPAIHLEGGPDAAPPSPARPKWQNWAIMVAVFVAGVAAGGYGWYARSEAVDAGRVELIALDFNGAVADNIEKSRLHATIHNAGARDVVVLGLRVPGWQAAPEEIRREVTIPLGQAGSLPVSGIPTCDAGLPESLEADVRTDGGVSTVPVPLPATNPAGFLFAMVCDNPEYLPDQEPGLYFIWDDAPETVEALSPPMVLGVGSTMGEVEIVDVDVAAPGFGAQATNVPVTVGHAASSQLELNWVITECAATQDLGSVDVEFVLADQAPVTTQLPPWSIAQLASFAAAECGQ